MGQKATSGGPWSRLGSSKAGRAGIGSVSRPVGSRGYVIKIDSGTGDTAVAKDDAVVTKDFVETKEKGGIRGRPKAAVRRDGRARGSVTKRHRYVVWEDGDSRGIAVVWNQPPICTVWQ